MNDTYDHLDPILEAALFAAGEPLTLERLQNMFTHRPSLQDLQSAIERIKCACESRGVEMVEVASGYRFQVKADYAIFLQKLWEKKPPKYSRALLETLALIIYRQP